MKEMDYRQSQAAKKCFAFSNADIINEAPSIQDVAHHTAPSGIGGFTVPNINASSSSGKAFSFKKHSLKFRANKNHFVKRDFSPQTVRLLMIKNLQSQVVPLVVY